MPSHSHRVTSAFATISRQPPNEELRDAAIPDLPIGIVGVLREDQGLEPVPARRPADPGARAGGLPRLVRDFQVEAYVEVVGHHLSSLEKEFLHPAVIRGATQLPRVSRDIQRLSAEFGQNLSGRKY